MGNISEEIVKFTKDASSWWDRSGPFAMLHKINPIRLEYIIKIIRSHFNIQGRMNELQILDIGCGGGLVSIPLSRIGALVTGIDLGKENIDVAQEKAQKDGVDTIFINTSIYDIEESQKKYDVIICLEVLEHVDDPESFIKSISKLVRKNGLVILSTINRNIKSKLLAIDIAEKILNIVPKGTHSVEKFIKPSEIVKYSSMNGLNLVDLSGLSFSFMKRDWVLSKDCSVNYFASFIKS